jgi:hypothetical protein
LRLKRIFVVLTVIAAMVAMAAVPAMAQNADKAAKKAAKQANKQAQNVAVPAGGASPNAAPANVGTQKALPSSGGMSAGNVALLGAGALLVGGGVLLHRTAARP